MRVLQLLRALQMCVLLPPQQPVTTTNSDDYAQVGAERNKVCDVHRSFVSSPVTDSLQMLTL